jgi:N-acetylmuramoyl-L-alanine amidase
VRVPLHVRAVAAIAVAGAALLGSATIATAAAPSPAPLVVIDPGHGGRYSNANSNGLKEKNVNLAVGLELRRQLIARGYRVKMTRTTDRAVQLRDGRTWNYSSKYERWYYKADGHRGQYGGIPKDDLQARARIANQEGADLFISIHANGSVSRSARGTETWASRRDRLGSQLAPYVHKEIVKSTGLRSRGTYSADFYVCRWTNMPAVLVETAFISSRSDARLLKKSSFRRKIAIGIATGVDRWTATQPYKKIYSRVSGSTAATLSAAVSQTDFALGAPVAVIARSNSAADLPGAPGLAVKLGGPLLWTDAGEISASTAGELARLAPQRLVLTGLDGSFDQTAVDQLAHAANLPVSAVEVVSAPDRSALAASIAARVGIPSNGEVLVVDAANSAAKLAAAPIAAAKGMPIFLADGGTIHPASAEMIASGSPLISRLVLVGPKSGLPAAVASGMPYSRVDGINLAQRAEALNARYFKSTTAGATRPVVASYESPTSYLTAATRAGRTRQPQIPVGNRTVPAFTREWITNRREAIGGFTLVDKQTMPYLMDVMLAKADR